MKIKLLRIALITVILASCNKNKQEKTLDNLIANDVPKFLHILPSLSHDSMQLAFKQANAEMKYKQKEVPTSIGALEASSEIEKGKMLLDGQLILVASPLLPHSDKNEFGISLIIYPAPTNDTILGITKSLLSKYKRKDIDNLPTWEINGWLLQLKGNNILNFRAQSNKSLYDLIE